MAQVINASDFYKLDGLKKDILDSVKALDDLNKSYDKMIDQSKAVNKTLQTQEATQSKTNKAIKQTNDNLDILAQSEQEQIKLHKQAAQITAKARAERTEENKTLIRAKLARQEQNKKIQDAIKLENVESNSIADLISKNKTLTDRRNKLSTATDEGRKRIAEINKQINTNNQLITKNRSNLEKQKDNIGNYQSALSGLPGPLGRASMGINTMGQSLKALLANPVVLIIAGIVGAITALVKALKRSEEGTDRLNKIMAALKAGLAVVLDIFTRLAVQIVDAFKDPQQAVKDLWEAIKQNLVNRIEALGNLFIGLKDISVNTFKLIGASVKNIFSDQKTQVQEFKDNIAEAGKDIGKSLFTLYTGADAEKVKDFFKEVTEEIKRESAAAASLAQRQAALNKAQRIAMVEEAKMRREINLLRETAAKKEEVSAEDRIKALDRAIMLENQILEMNQRIAAEKLAITSAQIALGESTQEDFEEEARLQAELIDLEASAARKRKLLEAERVTALREIAKEREEAAKLDVERELLNEKKKLENFKGTEEEKAKAFEQFAIKTLELQIEFAQQQLEVAELTAAEKIALESDLIDKKIALEEKLTKKTEDNEKQRLEYAKERHEQIIELANSSFELGASLNERQLADLEAQKQYELDLAGDNAAAKERIEKDFAEKSKQTKRQQAITDKLQAAFNIGLSTAQGIMAALAMIPPNVPLSVLIGATGIVQLAAVLAKPIPFKKGTKGLQSDTYAEFGEDGREIIREPGKPAYIAAKRTIDLLPKGTEIIPNYETEKILSNHGGVTDAKFNELIKEERATRKAIANQIHHNTIITEQGFRYQTKKGNTEINWMNKYLHRD